MNITEARLNRETLAKVGTGAALLCLQPYHADLWTAFKFLAIDLGMGKSDKKVKTNRITALRKQYDAFLEEDKKRKERNEYILGKLDKIRTYSPVIQLHYKGSNDEDTPSCTRFRPIHLSGKPAYDFQSHPGEQSQTLRDVSNSSISESLLLNKISRNYILIPKRITTFTNPYAYDAGAIINENTDWKSKYQILDQLLKQNEKEEPVPKQKVITIYDAEQSDNSHLNTVENEARSLNPHELEVPEKDLHNNKINYGLTDNAQKHFKNMENEAQVLHDMKGLMNDIKDTDNAKAESNVVEYNNSQLATLIFNADPYTNANLKDCLNEKIIPFEYLSNTNEQQSPTSVDNVSMDINNKKEPQPLSEPVISVQNEVPETEIIDRMRYNEESAMTVTNRKELEPEIARQEGSNENEYLQYPIDIISSQEFTPNDEVQLQDGVNFNPEEHVINENAVDTTSIADNTYLYDPQLNVDTVNVDDSESHAIGIEEFETEQREMFYEDENTDNQAEGDAGYADQQNYQVDDQYQYYEQQSYPAEINEHEETTQRYDPSYEAQYTKYDYEQQGNEEGAYDQAAYEQPLYEQQGYEQQAYDQQSGYEQQPQHYPQDQYEQLQYQQQNHETANNVQQQLDNEMGFVQPPNEQKEIEQPEVQESQQIDPVAGENSS